MQCCKTQMEPLSKDNTGGSSLPHPSCPISSKDDNEIRSIKMYSTPRGEAEHADGHGHLHCAQCSTTGQPIVSTMSDTNLLLGL